MNTAKLMERRFKALPESADARRHAVSFYEVPDDSFLRQLGREMNDKTGRGLC